MTTFGYRPAPRPSPLPLILAGGALLLATWAAVDRMGWLRPSPSGEPRAITPRGDLADYEKSIVEVFESNAPSVVHITTEKIVTSWRGLRRRERDGSGSGFIWDDTGVVVTNAHVVAGYNVVQVAVADTVVEADVIGRRPDYDIAVLRLRELPVPLRPIPVGTSSDLRIGQTAIAIGNPFGLDQTLTTGVISQLNRTITTEKGVELQGVIQVDAAINPGNSGGPLLDSAGRLIGMNSAIFSPSGASAGIGFAVPVDTVNVVVPYLLAGQRVRRDLGVTGETIGLNARATGYRDGVQITGFVGPGAREAGLKVFDPTTNEGDIIVRVDGLPVRNMGEILYALRDNVRGEKVEVEFLRVLERGSVFSRLKVNVELADGDA